MKGPENEMRLMYVKRSSLEIFVNHFQYIDYPYGSPVAKNPKGYLNI